MSDVEEELKQELLTLARKFHDQLGPGALMELGQLDADTNDMLHQLDDPDEVQAYLDAPVTGCVLVIGRGNLEGSAFATVFSPRFQDPFFTTGLLSHALESR